MSGNRFLDTNILIYAVDSLAPPEKTSRASRLVREVLGDGTGTISYQVAQEFVHVVRRGKVGFQAKHATTFLNLVLDPMLRVHSSTELFRSAIDLANRYQFPWYDSLVVAAAIEARCEILYSEDFQDGLRIGSMTVRNPFAADFRV